MPQVAPFSVAGFGFAVFLQLASARWPVPDLVFWPLMAVSIFLAVVPPIYVGLKAVAAGVQARQDRPPPLPPAHEPPSRSLFELASETVSMSLPPVGAAATTYLSLRNRGGLIRVERVTAAPHTYIEESSSPLGVERWLEHSYDKGIRVRPHQWSRLDGPLDHDSTWDATKPERWVLVGEGWPRMFGPGDMLALPGFELNVDDPAAVLASLQGGGQCKLGIRLAIQTDRGTQELSPSVVLVPNDSPAPSLPSTEVSRPSAGDNRLAPTID